MEKSLGKLILAKSTPVLTTPEKGERDEGRKKKQRGWKDPEFHFVSWFVSDATPRGVRDTSVNIIPRGDFVHQG